MILNRFIFIILLMSGGKVLAADSEQTLGEAFKAYQENRLTDAQKLYLSIVDTGVASGDVIYDLGNVTYRLGHLGEALLYYEKAARLIPRDPDVRANLAFIRHKLATDGLVDRSSLFDLIFAVNSYVTLSESVILICILSSISFITAFIFMFFRQDVLKWSAMSFFSILLFFLISTGVKYRDEQVLKKGVVISGSALLTPTFLEREGEGFPLPEGTIVVLKGRQKSGEITWVQVVLPGGKTGWVPSSEVGSI